jgi:hypothetical protein
MPRGLALGSLALGLVLVACAGDDEREEEVEVAPKAECRGSGCNDLEDNKTSQAQETTSTPAPTPTDETPKPQEKPSGSKENTCETAVDLGQMAGERRMYESEVEKLSTQGTCSTWVKLRVNETSNDFAPMEIEATLISPASLKFDLFAYVNVKEDVLSCQTPYAMAASTVSNIDELPLSWKDDYWGDDDSRTVTFHVRSRNGQCAPDGSWSLVVRSTFRFRN